jgi:Tol biopolymer transport system component
VAVGCSDEPGGSTAKPGTAAPALAVSRVRTGNPPRRDIVLTGRDGGRVTVLSGASLKGSVVPEAGRPAWAPNGRRIAFAGATSASRRGTDIYVVEVGDGHAAVRVTNAGDAHEPVWSPDGRRLVFTRLRETGRSRGALWSVKPDGSGRRALTRAVDGRIDLADSFSPDGRRLLFTRMTSIADAPCGPPGHERCSSLSSALYTTNADGSDQQRLLGHARTGAFSPDGQSIAFASDRDRNGSLNYGDQVSFAGELYLMRADGTSVRRLTHTRGLNESSPSWSADGARIAFQQGEVVANAEGTRTLEVNPDGSCRRSVLADPRLDTWYRQPQWRPGKRGRVGRLAC